MFFILSKTVAFLLLPSNFLIIAGLIGLVLMATRRRRAGKRVALTCLVLLLAIAILPLWVLLTNPLENRFPPWDPARGAPDGIVILGGAINPDVSADRGAPQFREDTGRIIAIAKLARQFPAARIIYSGGNGSLFPGQPAEADFLAPVLDDFGVPRSRVVLENRSRNTIENAVFSKDIAQPKPGERWLLVTSAWHMPRAIGCFRRAGFPVEAYPVDWRTRTHPRYMISTWPVANLYGTDVIVHEWLGLLAYWVTGRTSQFLPAP
jgi:uncharacterized SAM-binding protein YcdF (DUF218 family)